MSGFQAYTDGGVLQFDASLVSYGFKEKGTATAVDTWYNNYPYKILTVTVNSASYPLVFLSGDRYWHFLSVNNSGAYWEFRYLVADFGYSGSFTFNYYVFDKMTIGGTYGLELYNSAGQLTFTSNQAPLSLIYAGMAPNNNTGGTITIGDMYGKTCAVMLSGPRLEQQGISGNGWAGYAESIKPLTNGVEVFWLEEWFAFHDGVVGNTIYTQGGQSMILVADVTGL